MLIRHVFLLLAGAMKALFAKGIVHRDLKPQNILLSHNCGKSLPSPENITLKIAGKLFLKHPIKFILTKLFRRFWVCTFSSRRKHGCNFMWVSNVYGSRSHNVSSIWCKGRFVVFRNDSFSMSYWKGAIPSTYSTRTEKFLREKCKFGTKVSFCKMRKIVFNHPLLPSEFHPEHHQNFKTC